MVIFEETIACGDCMLSIAWIDDYHYRCYSCILREAELQLGIFIAKITAQKRMKKGGNTYQLVLSFNSHWNCCGISRGIHGPENDG